MAVTTNAQGSGSVPPAPAPGALQMPPREITVFASLAVVPSRIVFIRTVVRLATLGRVRQAA